MRKGETLIHSFVEAYARRDPRRVAVEAPTPISYDELNAKANAIARALIRNGVAQGSVVGLCGRRSGAALAGLLGILKAGAAYLYFDPAWPDDRCRATVVDSGVEWALDCEDDAVRISASMLPLSSVQYDDSGNLDIPVETHSPAVVLYTSGSSGRPRGVVLSHAAIVRRACDGYPPLPRDLQKTSWSLAAHLSDTLLPLVHGMSLRIIAEITDVRVLAHAVERYGTSRIVIVPSLLEAILDAPAHVRDRFRSVGRIVLSGETLTLSTARRCATLMPWVTLLNAYGATETCGFVSMGEVSDDGCITVGRPSSGWEVTIRDESLQPVAAGAPGEICVAGPQLSSGYWRDEAATASRFCEVVGEARSRVYRTGDIGRVRPDGRVEVIGRRDLQVKVRGFRVQLEEIEAALTSHPCVEDAAVIANSDEISVRLDGYVTLTGAGGVDSRQLRAYVSALVPGYMVPHRFVILPEMPRLVSGKIDRQQLSTGTVGLNEDGVVADTGGRRADATPFADYERLYCKVAQLWKSELGASEIRKDETFLESGGDSLSGMRVIMSIEECLGVTVTLDELLEAANLPALVALVLSRSPVDAIDLVRLEQLERT